MKTRPILRMICAVCTVVLLLFAFFPLQSPRTDASDWLSSIPDDRPLTDLAIPGTHDSGALYSIADVAGKCQSLSIADQLEIGVRFFDIRLQLRGSDLAVVHSFVDQLTDFDEVLDAMTSFLREHPSEFLLVSIKEDADPTDPTTSFSDAVERALADDPDLIRPDRTLPATTGEARGGMYIIARYADASVGIPAHDGWQDNTSFALGELYVQDHYAIEDPADKIRDIEAAFAEAKTTDALTLNFTSCYLTHGYPPISAAVPAEDILPWLISYLSDNPDMCGVVICDYMTSEMSETIRRCNET